MTFIDNQDDPPVDDTDPYALAPVGALTASEMARPSDIEAMIAEGRQQYRSGMGALATTAQEGVGIANSRKALLQRGLDRLLGERDSKAPLLLAMSSGFLRPNVTGSFGESLGNASAASVQPAQELQALRRVRRKDSLDLELGMADADTDASKIRQGAAKDQATLGQRTVSDALKADSNRLSLLARMRGADSPVVRLQRARDELPANDPRRVEIQAQIDKINKPTGAGALTATQVANNTEIDKARQAVRAILPKDKVETVDQLLARAMNPGYAAMLAKATQRKVGDPDQDFDTFWAKVVPGIVAPQQLYSDAQQAIHDGADPAAVRARLQSMGVDPGDLGKAKVAKARGGIVRRP